MKRTKNKFGDKLVLIIIIFGIILLVISIAGPHVYRRTCSPDSLKWWTGRGEKRIFGEISRIDTETVRLVNDQSGVCIGLDKEYEFCLVGDLSKLKNFSIGDKVYIDISYPGIAGNVYTLEEIHHAEEIEEGFFGFGVIGGGVIVLGGGALLFAKIANIWGEYAAEKRRKHAKYMTTLPGLYDTAQRLSREATSLFNQRKFADAQSKYERALENFQKAREAAVGTGKTDLVPSIDKALENLRTNITICEFNIEKRELEEIYSDCVSRTKSTKEKYKKADYVGALHDFERIHIILKNSVDRVRKLGISEMLSSFTTAIRDVETNVEACKIGIDKKHVEALYGEAERLYGNAIAQKDAREVFKASDTVTVAEQKVDQAFQVATQRNFADALKKLHSLRTNIMALKYSIGNIIASGAPRVAPEKFVPPPPLGVVCAPASPFIQPTGMPDINGKAFLELVAEAPEEGKRGDLSTRYENLKFIGGGGFAHVYKAVRKQDGTFAALKVPKDVDVFKTIDLHDFKSFIQEARLWYSLSQEKVPGVIQVYEFGIKPYPWIAMEYMPNGNLRDFKTREKTDLKRILQIIISILNTLQEAHFHGVVHRDLKPENILFDANFNPHLGDWGVSRVLLDLSTSSRGTKGFVGTPIYASPEQFAPKRFGKIDRRTDIYQVGAILYELVAGNPPFEGTFEELMFAVVNDLAEPPSRKNPVIPRKLDSIILKSLEKEKNARYQDAKEFKMALETVLNELE